MKCNKGVLPFAILFTLCSVNTAGAENIFSVYGANALDPYNGDNCYHPENHGAALLGTSDRTGTFTGTYNYYIVTSSDGHLALIDAIQGSDQSYIWHPPFINGNATDFQHSWGPPDGVFAHVGSNRSGGCMAIEVTGMGWTSITVYSPAPYYCDYDGDGFIGITSSGNCIGANCIPSGCQAYRGTDCDDSLNTINPGASETCDSVDNNCNGQIDENLVQLKTITGTVHYDGAKSGTIYIGALDPNTLNIVSQTNLPAVGGPYSLSLPNGIYYIVAQMDEDNSGSIDLNTFKNSEPSGGYDASCGSDDALTVPSCGAVL